MTSQDFSVEEEVGKILDILERACKRFGVNVSPQSRDEKCESEATREGEVNGDRG